MHVILLIVPTRPDIRTNVYKLELKILNVEFTVMATPFDDFSNYRSYVILMGTINFDSENFFK